MKKNLILILLALTFINESFAAAMVGRLGIGMTDHIASGMEAISMKLQRNRSSAIGGHFGLNSSSDGVFYAVGLKVYRYIYEEPQLNFYSSLGAGLFTYKNASDDTEQGYQVDGTFGTEFSFQGLESVGFSFEFGVGLHQYNNQTNFKTVGYNALLSAVHFYL